VRRLGELLSEEYDGDVAVIRAVLEPRAIGQLERLTGLQFTPVVQGPPRLELPLP
jgi:hypothetical protein